jgi:N6-adenosine-specific RNA methylase IME4
LFSRERRNGWQVYGGDVEKFDHDDIELDEA